MASRELEAPPLKAGVGAVACARCSSIQTDSSVAAPPHAWRTRAKQVLPSPADCSLAAPQNLKEKLDTRLQTGSVTFQELQDMVAADQAAGTEGFTSQELQAAVRQLADEDLLNTSGTGYQITITRGVRA
jgi:hypothetical protein